jgi:hypothetical protein
LVDELQQRDFSFDSAVKTVAKATLTSPSTLRAAHTQFTTRGTLPTPPTKHRGSGNLEHPRHITNSKLTLEGELLLHQLLQDVREKNTQETITTLRAGLAQHGINVSRTTVFRRLHALSYRYTNKRFIGATSLKVLRNRRRAFVYRMAAARRLEKEGTHVIVGQDESYVHQRKAGKKIWANPSQPDSKLVRGDADGGRRLIIVHAITKDGLLHVPGVEPTAELEQKQTTAELVFESHGSDGDYHRCMNGETFMLWLKNRLFPAFEAKYSGKKMILLLDNVKYHHHRGPLWLTPRSMDQEELAMALAEHVPEFKVTRGRGKFKQEITIKKRYYLSDAKSKPPGPTLGELRAELTKWLETHPQVTEVCRVMEEHGHQLLYTPPFQPEVQPIELLWGKAKREVARQYVRGRNIHETKKQMQVALRSITSDDCARFFRQTDEHLEKWLQADEELRQFHSFAAMIDSPALSYKTHEDEDRCDDEHSDENDSDEEEDETREEE